MRSGLHGRAHFAELNFESAFSGLMGGLASGKAASDYK
jgi:hypothetical protein